MYFLSVIAVHIMLVILYSRRPAFEMIIAHICFCTLFIIPKNFYSTKIFYKKYKLLPGFPKFPLNFSFVSLTFLPTLHKLPHFSLEYFLFKKEMKHFQFFLFSSQICIIKFWNSFSLPQKGILDQSVIIFYSLNFRP